MSISSISSNSGAPLAVNGLVSGINTSQVIQALLEGYQIPINNLEQQQSLLNSQSADYQTLNTDVQGLRSVAETLNTPSSWDFTTATTSNDQVATATTGTGAQPGSLSFTVDALAQGNVVASSGSVASEGTRVTTAPSLLVATGGAALGFSSLGAGAGLALGSHAIDVTQSSAAASVTGTPAGSTTITGGANDTVDLQVNGTAYALTLAAGTYDPSQLATAVTAAATAAGAPVTASVDGSGDLELSTQRQGSAASVQVTGGDGLGALGLTSGQSGTGADAIVTVDGTSTTLTSIDPNQTLTLGAPSGSVQATVAGTPGPSGALVSAGSAASALVSTGNGSLSQVVSAINGSGLAATANAVHLASGNFLLQVSANGTGAAGAVSLDPAAFSGSPLGQLSTITEAQDASVSVGGAAGYTLTSSTDTFTGLLPGTTVTVAGKGNATVTVVPDATGAGTAVSSLVAAANKVLGDINTFAGYNAQTRSGGPLMGSAVLTGLQQQVLSIFGEASGTSGLGNASDVGITLGQGGTLSFNQSTFESAYAAHPGQVAGLFTQGGRFAGTGSPNGNVSLVYAGTGTVAGSYDVHVTQSATQATDAGSVLAGAVTVGESLSVVAGGATATYQTSAGEGLSAVASGLNQAFATAGLDLTASTAAGGTQLQVVSNAYGSATGFSVTSTATGPGTTGLAGATAGTAASFAGTDVAGTINGAAATGSGQVLAAASTDPVLAGLALLVTATGVSGPTDLGHFTYQPGVAQQLAAVADGASNAQTGSLSVTIKSLQDQAQAFNPQIARYQGIANDQQNVLTAEFATLESTLGLLKNESSMLATQIAGLP